MCRLALQLLGMLGNVLSRPRHVLQHPKHVLQHSRHAYKVLGRSRHAFARSPHLLPYMEAWWYTTPLASQLIRQQVGEGGFSLIWYS